MEAQAVCQWSAEPGGGHKPNPPALLGHKNQPCDLSIINAYLVQKRNKKIIPSGHGYRARLLRVRMMCVE